MIENNDVRERRINPYPSKSWLGRVVRTFSFLSILLSGDTTSFGEDRSRKRISLD